MNKVEISTLDRAMYDLSLKYPFYGLFLTEFERSYNDRIPYAAGIGLTDRGTIALLVHPEQFDALSREERVFVIAHETLHMIFHVWEQIKIMPDHKILNIAADLTINQLLRGIGMTAPEGVLFPELFPNLELEKDQATIYYYRKLREAQDKKNKEGSSGDTTFDKMLDSMEDLHPEWAELGEIGDEKIEDFNFKTEGNVRQASQGVGNIPQHIQDVYPQIFNPTPPIISWKQVLRKFVGSKGAGDPYSTRKRPNKRFQDAAATKIKFKKHIIFSIDSSGSISDEQYLEFYNEIHHAYKSGVQITIHLWDTEVV